MSYTIFYRSLFVKTREGKYIPMVEMGDNNVYECDRKRRAREWSNVRINEENKAILTANEIMGGIERWVENKKEQYIGRNIDVFDENSRPITAEDVERNFGDYDTLSIGSAGWQRTTAQMVRNFFKRGIERAVNFDDIKLEVYWYIPDPECEWKHNYERRYPKTEEELASIFEEAKKENHSPYVTFVSKYEAEYILNGQKLDRLMKRSDNHKEHKKGFVVTIHGDYIKSTTPRYFYYIGYLSGAHVYTTRKAAEHVQQRILRNKFTSEIIDVVKEDGVWKKAA